MVDEIEKPESFYIGQEVLRNDLCEFVEVVAVLEKKGAETLYQVDGYSIIEANKGNDGQLEGWFRFDELTA